MKFKWNDSLRCWAHWSLPLRVKEAGLARTEQWGGVALRWWWVQGVGVWQFLFVWAVGGNHFYPGSLVLQACLRPSWGGSGRCVSSYSHHYIQHRSSKNRTSLFVNRIRLPRWSDGITVGRWQRQCLDRSPDWCSCTLLQHRQRRELRIPYQRCQQWNLSKQWLSSERIISNIVLNGLCDEIVLPKTVPYATLENSLQLISKNGRLAYLKLHRLVLQRTI